MFLKNKNKSQRNTRKRVLYFKMLYLMQTSRVPRKQNLDAFLSFFIFFEGEPSEFICPFRPTPLHDPDAIDEQFK